MLLTKEPGVTLCNVRLDELQNVDFWHWHDERSKQVAKSTVSRERNMLQAMFRMAQEQWGYEAMVNPFRDKTIKGGKVARTRRLEEPSEYDEDVEGRPLEGGECDRLIAACAKCRTRENRL